MSNEAAIHVRFVVIYKKELERVRKEREAKEAAAKRLEKESLSEKERIHLELEVNCL